MACFGFLRGRGAGEAPETDSIITEGCRSGHAPGAGSDNVSGPDPADAPVKQRLDSFRYTLLMGWRQTRATRYGWAEPIGVVVKKLCCRVAKNT